MFHRNRRKQGGSMNIKFEKEETKEEIIDGKTESIKSFVECAEKDATYKHICGHDKNPPEPCRRVKI